MLIIIFNIISALFRTCITPQHETHEQEKHTWYYNSKGYIERRKVEITFPLYTKCSVFTNAVLIRHDVLISNTFLYQTPQSQRWFIPIALCP